MAPVIRQPDVGDVRSAQTSRRLVMFYLVMFYDGSSVASHKRRVRRLIPTSNLR
jgi:hypothetical protein